MRTIFTTALAMIALLGGSSTTAGTVTVKVKSVPLGDVFTTETSANMEMEVALEGADAPDKEQPLSRHATKALSDKILSREVTVEVSRMEGRNRIWGKVMLGDRWINKEMIAEGWAWHHKAQVDSKELAEAEQAARKARRGIWRGEPQTPPWEWRKRRAEMGAAKEAKGKRVSNDDVVYVTDTSNKYHRKDCRRLRHGKRRVTRAKAEKWSYTPCPVCKP